jgi:hypothetical protein
MFSVYRLLCLPVCFSLDILSIHVYVYINQLITHTHTHTRSLFMSLSRLYMCVNERGGGGPSLSMCMYPGTPDINSVEPICRTAPKRKGSREIRNV